MSQNDRGVQPTNNNLPTNKRSRQSVPRRLGAAKPHIFRAISMENTKPQVLSAAVRPIDETFPEAARLTVTYNQQPSRHRQAVSADDRFPLLKCKPATSMCRRHASCGFAALHGALRRFMRRQARFIYSPVPLRFLRALSAPLCSQTVPHCRRRQKAPLS